MDEMARPVKILSCGLATVDIVKLLGFGPRDPSNDGCIQQQILFSAFLYIVLRSITLQMAFQFSSLAFLFFIAIETRVC